MVLLQAMPASHARDAVIGKRLLMDTLSHPLFALAPQSAPAGVITHGVRTTTSGGTVTGAMATVPMSTTDRHPMANGTVAASFRRPGTGEEFYPAEVRHMALQCRRRP